MGWHRQQPPLAGSIVKVRATGNEFNGRMQLAWEKIRAAESATQWICPRLIPCAPRDRRETDEVVRAVDHIADPDLRKNHLRALDRAGDKLLTFPAAKQMHHAERRPAPSYDDHASRGQRDRDRLSPAERQPADGGRHRSRPRQNRRDGRRYPRPLFPTQRGWQTHRPIVRGVVNIQLAAEKTKASPGKALLLQHMVLSHHGIPEYGSPLAPKFPEAEVLNHRLRLTRLV